MLAHRGLYRKDLWGTDNERVTLSHTIPISGSATNLTSKYIPLRFVFYIYIVLVFIYLKYNININGLMGKVLLRVGTNAGSIEYSRIVCIFFFVLALCINTTY